MVHSIPDLYHAKIKLEERLKGALNFDFGFESPIVYVRRFFDCAFSPAQQDLDSIKKWREDTETLICTCAYMPLGQWINTVFLAAGFLHWSKQNIIQQSLNNGEKIPDLPEVIGGHPWFMYVDPEVDLKSTEFISQTIDSEFKFMLKIMGSEEDAGDNQEEKDGAEIQDDHEQIFTRSET